MIVSRYDSAYGSFGKEYCKTYWRIREGLNDSYQPHIFLRPNAERTDVIVQELVLINDFSDVGHDDPHSTEGSCFLPNNWFFT